MRDVFPPRVASCADPVVPYENLSALTELARVTYADASAVRPVYYDGQALVEVYANGGAIVVSREHVLAQQAANEDLEREEAHAV